MLNKVNNSFILALHFALIFSSIYLEGKAQIPVQMSNGRQPLNLADPCLFVFGNTYYLYGTNGKDANQGFEVFTSNDLQTWESPEGPANGFALRKEDVFGEKGFWAPQVFFYKEKFYFVDGKTQTKYPWDSWRKQYTAEPELWFHEILHADGTAYRQEEVDLIRSMTQEAN